MRYSRADYAKMVAAQQELARAEEDYQRLRAAYLEAAHQPGQDVAMAMIGADMDKAHAVLQSLIGLPHMLAHHHEPMPAAEVHAPVEREQEEQGA